MIPFHAIWGLCWYNLMQQLEKNGGADRPVFKSLHPMTAWSLVHAAWIRNHFVVQEGQTAFERAFDRIYNGKICAFGEVVLGLIKTTKKGAPSWRKGIWLTKSTNNDVHLVAFGEHVFCTRSIRRLPKQWDLKLAGDVTAELLAISQVGSMIILQFVLEETTLLIIPAKYISMCGTGMLRAMELAI